MLETICIGHIVLAGIIVGALFVAGMIIKPAPIPSHMTVSEEARFDTMIVNNDDVMLVQMKEHVQHGSNQEQKALTLTSN